MKYPKCPLCDSDWVRKSVINKRSYWKCWKCKTYFDLDFLFVVTELPLYKQKEEEFLRILNELDFTEQKLNKIEGIKSSEEKDK